MEIINIFIYIKYCYYFHKLLVTLLLIKYNMFLFNEPSIKLINKLYNDVQNNGCVIIKIVQWLHNRYTYFYTTEDTYQNYLLYKFKNIYEKCKIHDLKYTKTRFNQEFYSIFDDIIEIDSDYEIKSGSIAQVYKATLKNLNKEVAIKVIHPHVQQQLFFPYLYYLIYNYLTNKFTFLQQYRIPFEMSEFFENFIKQTNMINEAKNMKKFYNEYKNNQCIIIPKPILWSKSILIMEFIEGKLFSELDVSEYVKYKIITIISLFVKNSIFFCDIYHADLHNSNWKVIFDDKNIPKIVIYDFGYCINNSKNEREIIKNIHKALDNNDIKIFLENLYIYIEYNPLNLSRQDFIDILSDYAEKNLTTHYLSNKTIQFTINYLIRNKYIFKSTILNLLISIYLVENHLKKYIYIEDVEYKTKDLTTIYNNKIILKNYNQQLYFKSFCEEKKSFYKLKQHFTIYCAEIKNKIEKNIDDCFRENKKKRKNNRQNTQNLQNTQNQQNRQNKIIIEI